jgi:hypothetical protein
LLLPSEQGHDRVDQRRLAGARRAREARNSGRAGVFAQGILEVTQGRIAAFDQANRPRQGADIAGPKAV